MGSHLFRHCVSCLCVLLFAASALAVRVEIQPPREGEFVRDLAGMLRDADERSIEQVAASLLSDLETPIFVVTIESMAKYGGHDLRIETFATLLFDQWGIGTPTRDNAVWNTGILLLVSRDDRKARIALGAGWRREHDAHCDRIMDERIIPSFKRGDFSGGIVAGVRSLDAMTREVFGQQSRGDSSHDTAAQTPPTIGDARTDTDIDPPMATQSQTPPATSTGQRPAPTSAPPSVDRHVPSHALPEHLPAHRSSPRLAFRNWVPVIVVLIVGFILIVLLKTFTSRGDDGFRDVISERGRRRIGRLSNDDDDDDDHGGSGHIHIGGRTSRSSGGGLSGFMSALGSSITSSGGSSGGGFRGGFSGGGGSSGSFGGGGRSGGSSGGGGSTGSW